MRTSLRKLALTVVRVALVQGARNGELEDAVPQELQSLVGVGALLGPRGMREDPAEPVGRKSRDQAAEVGAAAPVTGGR
jgi:hypothetical protein